MDLRYENIILDILELLALALFCSTFLQVIFIEPMCTWGPIIGSQSLSVPTYKTFFTLVDDQI